jgi:hypothetical protein
MENDIAAIAAGYVGLRLVIVAICAYSLYRLATFRKPVEISVESNEADQQSPRKVRDI